MLGRGVWEREREGGGGGSGGEEEKENKLHAAAESSQQVWVLPVMVMNAAAGAVSTNWDIVLSL